MKYFERYGKVLAMSAAALGMTAALTIESSMAYFTTYVSAGGSQVVNLGAQTTIHEEIRPIMTKHIQISNASMINDCFVRVKILYGSDLSIGYPNSPDTPENTDWYTDDTVDENGFRYVYYRPVLPASPDPEHPSLTSPLDVKINVPEGFDRDNFNVVVVQECTPVDYDEDGNATADWTTVYSEYEEYESPSGREGAED